MPADRPEDKAARVEKVLESGNLDGAMQALQSEVQGLSQPDRDAVFKSLKEQNVKANEKDWTLPNVDIEEVSNLPFGLWKTGETSVNMSHNAFEKGAQALDSLNPFSQIAKTLDKAAQAADKKEGG